MQQAVAAVAVVACGCAGARTALLRSCRRLNKILCTHRPLMRHLPFRSVEHMTLHSPQACLR